MRYVYRHYIIFGGASVNIAVLGECVARILAVRDLGVGSYGDVDGSFFVDNRAAVDGEFWRFHDEFYENWDDASEGGFSTLWFGQFAREKFDVEADELYLCAEKDTGENGPLEFVRRSHDAAETLGIAGTPTVFVNGTESGWEASLLLSVVDDALSQ